MKLTVIFHFLFPKTICIESAAKFRSLQLARYAKAGIVIEQIDGQSEIEVDPLLDNLPHFSSFLSPISLAA